MDELIYNQRTVPGRYGLRPSAQTGCGWVAAYNALVLLGGRVDREKLIRYFEWQLPLVHGNAGTSLWGPALCFKKWGFPVKMLAKRKEFDQAARAADACILFYRWRSGMRLGAHFVALHHTDRGFVGYNTYKNSTGPDYYGESLADFLQQRGYFGAVLTAISQKPRDADTKKRNG
ncbi:MAG: hypothetical protein Q4F17_00605 [Eubacteriales bacterium]|nr:hypothetical protein [Eubacteriales bacterium]